MSTNKNNREFDRDKELQNKDRDQLQQQKDRDKDQNKKLTPKRLQDEDHQMDERTNDVESGDSYRRKLDHDDAADGNNRLAD